MKNFSLNKRAFLTVLLALSVVAGMAQTTFTVGDLNYQVNTDGVSVTVTGHALDYEHANGPLVIPESVNYQGNDYVIVERHDRTTIFKKVIMDIKESAPAGMKEPLNK